MSDRAYVQMYMVCVWTAYESLYKWCTRMRCTAVHVYIWLRGSLFLRCVRCSILKKLFSDKAVTSLGHLRIIETNQSS